MPASAETQPGQNSPHPFTEAFTRLHESHRGRPVTVEEIRAALGPEGAPAFIILLALPFCLPVTIPGLSTPFGLSIAYLSRRMLLGQPPRLPKRVSSHQISAPHFEKLMRFTIRWWNRIEKVVHRRLDAVGSAPWMKPAAGWLIFLNALVLCLPVPIPLSNTFPALAIVGFSLAAIEKDGVCFLSAAGLSLLGFVYVIGLIVLGKFALLRWLGAV